MGRTVSTLEHIVKEAGPDGHGTIITLCGQYVSNPDYTKFLPGDTVTRFHFTSRKCKRCAKSQK